MSGDNAFEVDRAVVDEIVDKREMLLRGVREGALQEYLAYPRALGYQQEFMNKNQVIKAITALGLDHLRQPLTALLTPSIRIRSLSSGENLKGKGISRFGGLPDFPPGSQWPRVDGIPLMFIGQINVKDIVSFQASSALPEQGLLSFFFDGMLSGYEHGKGQDRCLVVLHKETGNLVDWIRFDPPKALAHTFSVYPENLVTFESQWGLPEFEEVNGDEFPSIPPILPLISNTEDREKYHKLHRTIRGKYISSCK